MSARHPTQTLLLSLVLMVVQAFAAIRSEETIAPLGLESLASPALDAATEQPNEIRYEWAIPTTAEPISPLLSIASTGLPAAAGAPLDHVHHQCGSPRAPPLHLA